MVSQPLDFQNDFIKNSADFQLLLAESRILPIPAVDVSRFPADFT